MVLFGLLFPRNAYLDSHGQILVAADSALLPCPVTNMDAPEDGDGVFRPQKNLQELRRDAHGLGEQNGHLIAAEDVCACCASTPVASILPLVSFADIPDDCKPQ
jgi:hypothetical protein